MKLFNLFKPKWQHGDINKRLGAVSKITSSKKLRKIVDQSKDERLRFKAACRLNDTALIKLMARSASQEAIRLEASIQVDGQSNLASIALNAWDIHLGQKAVKNIHNEYLLQRIARSAKQDAIRLAAALRLKNTDLLRQVACSSNHIDVYWQVAKHLDDPRMLAEVILFKPANMRLEPLRRKARRALTEHLNRCRDNNDHEGLVAALKAVPHPSFKIEALVRLLPEKITPAILRHMTHQDFRYIPNPLLDKMVHRITAAGWQTCPTLRQTPCDYCQSKGELSLRYLSSNDVWVANEKFPCPDCRGEGMRPLWLLTCRKQGNIISLKLPAKPSQY